VDSSDVFDPRVSRRIALNISHKGGVIGIAIVGMPQCLLPTHSRPFAVLGRDSAGAVNWPVGNDH